VIATGSACPRTERRLFDDIVGDQQQFLRHHEAKRLRRFEIDDKFEF
jgi:hypothetical protein